MKDLDLSTIFNDKLPWVVRYGLIISVVCIAIVCFVIAYIGKGVLTPNILLDVINKL